MDFSNLVSGYGWLFVMSFLASTVLPVGSEWLLVTLLLKNYSPALTVAVATTGNILGAWTTYGLGLWGGRIFLTRILRVTEPTLVRAEQLYNRHGAWSLLLSWVPVIGDPLCALSGLFRTPWWKFLILAALGKVARYGVVTLACLWAKT